MALQTLKRVLTATRALSVMLQGSEIDLIKATRYVGEVLLLLQRWRDGQGSGAYTNVYKDA